MSAGEIPEVPPAGMPEGIEITPEDRQAMIEAELEARRERDQLQAVTDPTAAWRTALSEAAADEGLDLYGLPDSDAIAVKVHAGGCLPLIVPGVALDGQRIAGVPPRAVAAMLKAVSIDPRLAWWDDEDDV